MDYEAFIERDLEGVAAAVREYRASHTAEELWQAVTRFAVLAYAPSQHAKRAVLSCLAAWELRDELGEQFDDVLLECARYTAQSRQPWSEPPIFDPPRVDASQSRDAGELRAAIAAHDRIRAELWLAARIDDAELARDLFRVAAEDAAAGGDALLIAVAAWKLAALLGEKGRFVALRIAMWELTAGVAASDASTLSADYNDEALLEQLIAAMVASGGDIAASQAIFVFDAALEASAITGDDAVPQFVRTQLSATPSARDAIPIDAVPPAASYPLARDYASCLIARAVTRRLAQRFPSVDTSPIVAAASHNLAHGSSFEDFAFA